MRRFTLISLSLLFFGCLTESVSYSPEQDDQAMASLQRAWEQPGGSAALLLCEDLDAAAVPIDNDCQIENVVRGGGRGTRHDESHGGGCGGCPFANEAYVKGSAWGFGLASPARVHGSVDLGKGNDAYAYPYRFVLFCDDPAAPCTLSGTLEADGSLHLSNEGSAEVALTPAGGATCSP